jgi:AmmeMemoRadiSam system protein B
MIRKPAVAGRFYPANPGELKKMIEGFITPGEKKIKAKAVVSPHAGYIYSGAVAGAVFSQIEIPNKIIILGPNHTGYGAQTAIMTEGSWELPFGEVAIDEEFARLILEKSTILSEDVEAHLYEHSLEVQLPFIQYLKEDITIVPIALATHNQGKLTEIGEAIGEAIAESKEEVLMVASSDMTHYEDQKSAEQKDKLAINEILALSPEKLLDTVVSYSITMCGVAPVVIALISANKLGAKSAKLIKYATSGDISGDYSQVVGYAGIIIW